MSCGYEQLIRDNEFQDMWRHFVLTIDPIIVLRRLIMTGVLLFFFFSSAVAVAVTMLHGLLAWWTPVLLGLVSFGVLWTFLRALIIHELLQMLKSETILRETSL